MACRGKTIICLLRNDLRIHDNEVLQWANRNADFVLPMYIFDPRHFGGTYHFGFPKTGPHRTKMLIESVQDLRKNLKLKGSGLAVRRGKPEEELKKMIDTLGQSSVQAIVFHEEVTQEEVDVEKSIRKCCGVNIQTFWGHTLYHKDDLPFSPTQTPDVYTQFRKRVEAQAPVRKCLGMPESFKPLPQGVEEGDIPTNKDLGVEDSPADPRSVVDFHGGESVALDRLHHYLWDTDAIATYKETRNGMLGADYSTKFSVWLAFGSLSPRYIFWEVKRYENERTANQSTYWVLFELIWRDYFRYVAVKYGNQIFYEGGIQSKNIRWKQDKHLFNAWKEGRTGVPFVDANMREMAATGFMSNRGRQNVASFLTKDLRLDWRLGAEWFESMLIDHDVCSNYGNWLYSAGIGNDPREDRKFNVVKQGFDYDSEGEYVRTWVPELKNIHGGSVHIVWTLSRGTLEKAGVTLGETYPNPVHVAPEWSRHYNKASGSAKSRGSPPKQQKGIDFYFKGQHKSPMAEESLSERQEFELQALQAIFTGDVVDLREKDAWKVARPPEIQITIKPQESIGHQEENHVQVDLLVKCPPRYPEEVPEFSFTNAKGLSTSQLSNLKSEIDAIAKENKGEEMLLQIAQHVQQFLHAHNKPPAKSFYEEMMMNKRKQEEQKEEEQRKELEKLRRKEEKELQTLEIEIQRRKEALKEENKKRKEETKQVEERPLSVPSSPSSDSVPNISPVGTPGKITRPQNSVSPSPLIVHANNEMKDSKPRRQRRTSTPCRQSPEDHVCQDHTGGIVVLAFNTKGERTVHRGTCLGHGSSGNTVYVGIDTTSGELVTISEWVLKWRHYGRKKLLRKEDEDEDKEGAACLKQVNSIEQELLSLIRLHHPNLVHYLAIKYQQDPGKITVFLLMEYCSGSSLSVNIRRKRPVHVAHLRHYTEEILEALACLHNKDVVHKSLRASSIFLDATGRIRVADYSIERRLSDLFYSLEQSRPGVHFDDHRPVQGRATKKGDVYSLGLVLLSLALGEDIDGSDLEIPSHFPASFQDFLNKCLIKDDKTRWSVHQLLDHSFIKTALPISLPISKPETQQEVHSQDDSSDEEQPLITPYEASGQSRLTNEFEILKSLGKGGFGDVIKVRNKLDRRFYAIKRIPLNPKSKQFNKKITREVKLLSRLNHENVVRYFNSWIEVSDDPAHSESSSSNSTTPRSTPKTPDKVHNSLDLTDNAERLAPETVEESVEWSRSYSAIINPGWDSEEDEEDEADVFGTSFLRLTDMSEDVVFIQSLDNEDLSGDQVDGENKNEKEGDESALNPKLHYLYIQMEYCEKSTLRNCIDASLYQDMNRVWRLFREIIEGLTHIHEQGMIHRDLKPVNIFLDSNDQVKIGDFGLATTSIINKSNILDVKMLTLSATEETMESYSETTGDGSLTGKVGTALYVSPEMMTGASKIVYSQKVDLYSLGIIFFEMCYKPLATGMERVKILGNLRLPEIKFPEDFNQYELQNQTHIIKWLLNHDPTKRASTKELLQSEYLPPPQMEEEELDEILRSTIADPLSKAYRHMLTALFSQTVNAADDLLFDSEFFKSKFTINISLVQESVQETLVRIFQHHGAVKVTTPLLMPKCDLYAKSDQYTRFMDHCGHLVSLPFDLRIPFVRYVARHNCSNVKRYCIERVFREKKVYGQHPRELTECVFDIVTPNLGSLIPDAEVVLLVQEIISEFPVLQQRNYYIKVNHVMILHAILQHCGVPGDQFTDVLHILSGVKMLSHHKNISKPLTSLGLNDQTVSSLLGILEMEGNYGKVASYLRCITKTRGEAATKAKQGLHELEIILSNLQTLGLKLPVIMSLGFVYNTHQFSGMIFQVMVDSKMKKHHSPDILAAGGRYDNLIKQFYSPLSQPVSETSVHGVGVSIAFEKIVIAVLESREMNPPSAYDILVCTTFGHKPMLKERMTIVRDLWAAGLRAEIYLDSMQAQEDIQEFCRSNGVSFMVTLQEGDTTIKVRSIEKDKITEKKLTTNSQVVDFLQQKLQASSKQEQSDPNQGTPCKSIAVVNSSDANTSNYSSNMLINFNFVIENGKMATKSRYKYESQIFAKVSSSMSWLPKKSIDVIAMELTAPVLKCIVAFLEVNGTEQEFEDSIGLVIEKQQRYRKYIHKICDQIFQLKFERRCNYIVLYGLKDDSIKLLT
ncbi:eIF-2-alpha kinase GCN2-like [Saccostrea echinata]|uniref:eIF-2-alpha kinase GCN2-like n=1 Tax=Saccostrea echinata TaxID=191078 RepID=UPI002A83C3E7|nr:eIF-2-alpha kinase GCN2-like [Saccostrea echinata]